MCGGEETQGSPVSGAGGTRGRSESEIVRTFRGLGDPTGVI